MPNEVAALNIAAAKWMFPTKPLETPFKSKQMLSNAAHSIDMLDLTEEEFGTLSSGLLQSYTSVFKAFFEHDELITYFVDHPEHDCFVLCLREDASSRELCLSILTEANATQPARHRTAMTAS